MKSASAFRRHMLEHLEARIAPATLSIANQSITEGSDGFAHAIFTVTLSAPDALPVTVDYATADGTAIAPGDYTAIPLRKLTIASGDTTGTIDVAIRSEHLFESGVNETFFVNLSNAVNATLTNAQAVGTILSDDGAPPNSITIDARHPYTFFADDHDRVTVRLSGPGTGTLILEDGATVDHDISEIHLTGTTVRSTLSVSVLKDRVNGDGFVRLGEVIVDGALAGFSGPAVDLTAGGLRATGLVKSISAHGLYAGEIVTGGLATDKLALTFRGELGLTDNDPFLLSTPAAISSLTASRVDVGDIHAAALTSIYIKAGALAADIHSEGAIGRITVKGGELSGDLHAKNFGPVTITGGSLSGTLHSDTAPDVLGRTKALASLTTSGDVLTGTIDLAGVSGPITVRAGDLNGTLTAYSFGAITVYGNSSANVNSDTPLETLGRTKALASFTVIGGGSGGDLNLAGAVGPITVRGGDLNGHLVAGSFGAVSITDSDFLGTLTSLTPAATLGTTKALASFKVTRGAFIGDIRLLGASGAISGGQIFNASIVASSIASVTATDLIENTLILAGADLGADFAIGGGNDTFGAGTIGVIKALRVTQSAIIGAGYTPAGPAIGGDASFITSFTVTKYADDNCLFAAGQFKTAPRIDGQVIVPANDARFKVG